MLTIEYTDELTVITCWCGINHAVPTQLRDFQRRQFHDGKGVTAIYCPLGHQHQPAGTTKVEELERQIERRRAEAGRLAARLAQAEASARAHKGHATRARKRAAAALCPCCNRSFVQLRRHMASQHPDYDPETTT